MGVTINDPGEKKFQDLLVEQIQQHIDHIDTFEGIAVDRHDYSEIYNYNMHDGHSMLPDEGLVSSLRAGYRKTFARIGELLHDKKNGEQIMLMNCNTVCRMDNLESFNGTFNEFGIINGVAWAGLMHPSVQWTYELTGRTDEELDEYFQQHLLMNVYPSAPVPDNDHMISPTKGSSAQVEQMYVASDRSERAIRTPVGETTRHILIVFFFVFFS